MKFVDVISLVLVKALVLTNTIKYYGDKAGVGVIRMRGMLGRI